MEEQEKIYIFVLPPSFFVPGFNKTDAPFLRREEKFFPVFPWREGKNFYPSLPKTTF